MKKNVCFRDSLKNAVVGYIDAFRIERNLRFHTAMAISIFSFAAFFGINKTQWAILILSVGLVIVTELLNSGIEKAVDTATNNWCDVARCAKDFAAGATLVSALCALGVGFCLFFDVEKIVNTIRNIFSNDYYIFYWIVVLIVDIVILCYPLIYKKSLK